MSGAVPSTPAPDQALSRRAILFTAVLTALIDLIGFSIIFPLFPSMLRYYLGNEGAGSAVGQLVALLSSFAGDDKNANFLVTVLFGGILGSLYSLLQFIFAPIWGRASDRFGRRPTLLITLVGTALSYVGWFFAGSFATLIGTRLLGGMMAGNLSTITAIVADVSDDSNRSRSMGLLGAAFGIGFILGPALGGAASLLDLSAALPALAAYGVNPFSTAALVALGLSAINLTFAAVRLPETLPPERRGRRTGHRTANPVALFFGARWPGVRRVNWIQFLFGTAFSGMEFTLVFLSAERFGYSARDNAILFIYVGVLIALVQGGLLRVLAKRAEDRRIALGGLCLLLPGFLIVGFAPATWALFLGLGFMAVGSALANPCLAALVSRYAPREAQGLATGTFRSMGALARAVGPIVGAVLYWKFGSTSPYVASAIFMSLPLLLTAALPPP